MADIEIKVALRDGASTKGELSESREKREIPAVVYGGEKKENMHVMVHERALTDAIKAGGGNAVMHLKHDKGVETVIVKDIQRHVVTSMVIHVDFQRVDLKKKITVKVPVHVVGEAPGVKLHGGLLEHILREIEVEALPGDIPQQLDVDVTSLNVGDAVKATAVKVPAGVTITEAEDQTVLHIVNVAVEEEPAPTEEGADASAEPEVLKQKKEGEDAEGDAKKDGGKKEGDKK
jgi:large subunit ribosomal protein L25